MIDDTKKEIIEMLNKMDDAAIAFLYDYLCNILLIIGQKEINV